MPGSSCTLEEQLISGQKWDEKKEEEPNINQLFAHTHSRADWPALILAFNLA